MLVGLFHHDNNNNSKFVNIAPVHASDNISMISVCFFKVCLYFHSITKVYFVSLSKEDVYNYVLRGK